MVYKYLGCLQPFATINNTTVIQYFCSILWGGFLEENAESKGATYIIFPAFAKFSSMCLAFTAATYEGTISPRPCSRRYCFGFLPSSKVSARISAWLYNFYHFYHYVGQVFLAGGNGCRRFSVQGPGGSFQESPATLGPSVDQVSYVFSCGPSLCSSKLSPLALLAILRATQCLF